MIRFITALAFTVIAVAVPVAQAAPPSFGPLDPTMAAAIRLHPAKGVQHSPYVPLDPTMAAAIRLHPANVGPHDLPVVGTIQTTSAAGAGQVSGVRAGAPGFDWGDFSVGAGAMLALVLAVGVLRKGLTTFRSSRSEGLAV